MYTCVVNLIIRVVPLEVASTNLHKKLSFFVFVTLNVALPVISDVHIISVFNIIAMAVLHNSHVHGFSCHNLEAEKK